MSYTPWDAVTQAHYEALEAMVGRCRVRLDPDYEHLEDDVEESVKRVMVELATYRNLYRKAQTLVDTERATTALCLDAIRAALQTDETGDALVGVARAAYRAEQELAQLERHRDEPPLSKEGAEQ